MSNIAKQKISNKDLEHLRELSPISDYVSLLNEAAKPKGGMVSLEEIKINLDEGRQIRRRRGRENDKSPKIKIQIPKGFMNCKITKDNIFVADTNDSSNWDELEFPLPIPTHEWKIYSYQGKNIVTLVDTN